MAPTPVSPGRLYGLLCEEFRRIRPAACGTCRPPLPEPVAEEPGLPNWLVHRPMSLCGPCAAALDQAARKLAPLYRLVDFAASSSGAQEPPGYGIDVRVDFVGPGRFVIQARALSPNGRQIFSAMSEAPSREEALREKEGLVEHVRSLLSTAKASQPKRERTTS